MCLLIGMISCSIWNRRNKRAWDKISGYVYGVKNVAISLLSAWKEAQIHIINHRAQEDQGDKVWQKPTGGWLKINMDAGVFTDGSIGIGAVIRDSQECFIGARCRKVEGAWRSGDVEVIGMKKAILWVISRGHQHCCVFETNLQSLSIACNDHRDAVFFGTLVGDCVYLLKHINYVQVKFVYRYPNILDHILAKTLILCQIQGNGIPLLLILLIMYWTLIIFECKYDVNFKKKGEPSFTKYLTEM
ncbi:uncharacterized protein LOC141679942 [Apium graveolens]|uniref:uncharacterized protein LOC141679942 n=1 Tax=Apium graveolens TaxID=4045 RepID=UPI003D7A3BF6